MQNTREIVLEILMEIDRENGFSNTIIRQVLDKYNYLDKQDKAFIKRVAEGSVERRIELDYILNQYSKVPVKKMKPLIRSLMRMSTYQLLYMDYVPDSAVCNEAVKLAEKRKFHSLKGFVNGVLRSIARSREALLLPDPEKDKNISWKEALSIKASMPMLIIDLWEADYGKEKTIEMTNHLLDIKAVTIRMEETLEDTKRGELEEAWKKQGVQVNRHPLIPYAYLCTGLESVTELPGFEEGLITVQDASSMLVTECAKIQKNDFVLDVCAAPGGKSFHALTKLAGTGTLQSRDVSEYKVDMIAQGFERIRANGTKTSTLVWDARETDDSMRQQADVVYLDVPCSGLGIMGKKRDIKYHVTPESLSEIVQLQREIIKASFDYVKPGGILMYSTCTVRKAENEEQVAWIVDNFPFELESLNPYLPSGLQNEQSEKGMLQLYPQAHWDGFFLARLRRKA